MSDDNISKAEEQGQDIAKNATSANDDVGSTVQGAMEAGAKAGISKGASKAKDMANNNDKLSGLLNKGASNKSGDSGGKSGKSAGGGSSSKTDKAKGLAKSGASKAAGGLKNSAMGAAGGAAGQGSDGVNQAMSNLSQENGGGAGSNDDPTNHDAAAQQHAQNSGANAVGDKVNQLKDQGQDKLKEKGKEQIKKKMNSKGKNSAKKKGKKTLKKSGKKKAGAKVAGKGAKGAAKGGVKSLMSTLANPYVLAVIGIIILIILIFFAVKPDYNEDFNYEEYMSERYGNSLNFDQLDFQDMATMVYYEEAAQSSYSYTVRDVKSTPDTYKKLKDNKFTQKKVTQVTPEDNQVVLDSTENSDAKDKYKVKRNSATTYTIKGSGTVNIKQTSVSKTPKEYTIDEKGMDINLDKGDYIEATGDTQVVITMGPRDKEGKEDQILLDYATLGYMAEKTFGPNVIAPEIFLNPIYTNIEDPDNPPENIKTKSLTSNGRVISPKNYNYTKKTPGEYDVDLKDNQTYNDTYYEKSEKDKNGMKTGKGVEDWGFAPIMQYTYGNEYEHASNFGVPTVNNVTLVKNDGTVPVNKDGKIYTGSVVKTTDDDGNPGYEFTPSNGSDAFILNNVKGNPYSKLIDELDDTFNGVGSIDINPDNQETPGWTVTKGMPDTDIDEVYLIDNAATMFGSFDVGTKIVEKNIGETKISQSVDYSDNYNDTLYMDKDAMDKAYGSGQNNNANKEVTISYLDGSTQVIETSSQWENTVWVTNKNGDIVKGPYSDKSRGPFGTIINIIKKLINDYTNIGYEVHSQLIFTDKDGNKTTYDDAYVEVGDYKYPFKEKLNYSAESTSPKFKYELDYDGDIDLNPVTNYIEDWFSNLDTIYFSKRTINKEDIPTARELQESYACKPEDNKWNDKNNTLKVTNECKTYSAVLDVFGYITNWETGKIDDIFSLQKGNGYDIDTPKMDIDLGEDIIPSDSEKKKGAAAMKSKNKEAIDSAEVYGTMYGIDKWALLALLDTETGLNHEGNVPSNSNGAAVGIGQIEIAAHPEGSKIDAYNQQKKKKDSFTVHMGYNDNDSSTLDLYEQDDNIRFSAMYLANKASGYEYNLLAAYQAYNYGSSKKAIKMGMLLEKGMTPSEANRKMTMDDTPFAPIEISNKKYKEYLKSGSTGWLTNGATLWYSGATSTGWDDKWNEFGNNSNRYGKYAPSGDMYVDYKDSDGNSQPSLKDAQIVNNDTPHGDPMYALKILSHYYGDVPFVQNNKGENIYINGEKSEGATGSIWSQLDTNVKIAATHPELEKNEKIWTFTDVNDNGIIDEGWTSTEKTYEKEKVHTTIYGHEKNADLDRYYPKQVSLTGTEIHDIKDNILAASSGISGADAKDANTNEDLILLSMLANSQFMNPDDVGKYLDDVFFDSAIKPILKNTEDTSTSIDTLVNFGRQSDTKASKGVKIDTSCKEEKTKSCYEVNSIASGVITNASGGTVTIDHGYTYNKSKDKYVKVQTSYENINIDKSNIKEASKEEIEQFDNATLCLESKEQNGNKFPSDCDKTLTKDKVFDNIQKKHYVEGGEKLGTAENSDRIRGDKYNELSPSKQNAINGKLFEFSYRYDGTYYNPNILITAMNGLLETHMDGQSGEGEESEQMKKFLKDNGCKEEKGDVFGKDCGTKYKDKKGNKFKSIGTWYSPGPRSASWTLEDYDGHDGADMNWPSDAPLTNEVKSVNDGVVVAVVTPGNGASSFYCPPTGQVTTNSIVEVLHYDEKTGKNYTTMYLHMEGIQVSPGDVVTSDTVLGYEGNVGCSTGQHLHYDVGEGYGTVRNDQGTQEWLDPFLNPRN